MGKKKNLQNLSEAELDFIEEKMKGDSALNYLTSEGLCTKLKALNFKLDIKCKNNKQKNFIKNLQDLNVKLNICDAPAGVGKSLLALTAGLYHLKNGNVSKVIVIVPTVEASEVTKIGLLPGSVEE
jgi:phosphate starvation-inducible protein PhoH